MLSLGPVHRAWRQLLIRTRLTDSVLAVRLLYRKNSEATTARPMAIRQGSRDLCRYYECVSSRYHFPSSSAPLFTWDLTLFSTHALNLPKRSNLCAFSFLFPHMNMDLFSSSLQVDGKYQYN